MGRNLTGPFVGLHIKIHGNTQILTVDLAIVVLMLRKLTIALTSSVKCSVNLAVAGFSSVELL
jgi:hypothetical protein